VLVAIPDRDTGGQKWANQVGQALDGKAASLEFRQAKTGKDAADHIAAEHNIDELVEINGDNAEENNAGPWINLDQFLERLLCRLRCLSPAIFVADPTRKSMSRPFQSLLWLLRGWAG
jgi:hypothetical protein